MDRENVGTVEPDRILKGMKFNVGRRYYDICKLGDPNAARKTGAMATSVVQTAIIMAALFSAFIFIFGNGGFEVIRAAAAAGTYPAEHLDFSTAYTVPATLMMFIPPAISGIGDIANFQRVNSAKTTRTIIVGQCISGVLVAICATLPVLIGMYAKAALGSEGTATFFDVIGKVFPPLLAAVVFTAVIAAIMSTIDCLFISSAQMFLNDIYKEMINPDVDDNTLRKWTLPLNVGIVAVSVMIALGADSILDLLSSTLVFVTASCLVPFMGGVVWKKATKEGAVVSACVGLIFACLEFFGLFVLPYSGITVYLPGLIAFIAVSLATQKKQIAAA